MARLRTPEQIIRKLREADCLLGEGATTGGGGEVARGVEADAAPLAPSVRRDEG
jgi:hypothetical protein